RSQASARVPPGTPARRGGVRRPARGCAAVGRRLPEGQLPAGPGRRRRRPRPLLLPRADLRRLRRRDPRPAARRHRRRPRRRRGGRREAPGQQPPCGLRRACPLRGAVAPASSYAAGPHPRRAGPRAGSAQGARHRPCPDQRGRMSRYGERVAVVGGGIAGLATAALLAADGRSVDLLEQRDEVGGRAGSWERDGFRFDTGPSWYLMPEVFEHCFGLLGTSAARELDLTRLDPGYRVFFEGHDESLEVRSDRAESVALFERVEPGAGAALEDYLDSAKRTYDAAVAHFLYTSFEHPRSVANADVLRSGPHLLPLLARSLE